jgi:MFS family permease
MALGAAGLGIMILANNELTFLAAFVGLGASNAGYQMSAQTLILEFGARQDVAMRLGISATVEGIMASASPLIGGLIAAAVGYPPVFAIAMALQLASLAVLMAGVREPRTRKVIS